MQVQSVTENGVDRGTSPEKNGNVLAKTFSGCSGAPVQERETLEKYCNKSEKHTKMKKTAGMPSEGKYYP
jgi:hypothetical protein